MSKFVNWRLLLIIIIAVLIIVGLVWVGSARKANGPEPEPIGQDGEVDTSDWQTYKNFGLEISYPSHWELRESEDLTLEGYPRDIRFMGDGYTFIVNPNSGMGLPPNEYKVVDAVEFLSENTINLFKEVKVLERTNPEEKYHIIVTMYRSDSNFFYPFRLSAPKNISVIEAKELMSKFLSMIEKKNLKEKVDTDFSKWQTYKNFGLEIKYPSTWGIEESAPLSVGGKFIDNYPAYVRFSGQGYNFSISVNKDLGFSNVMGNQYRLIEIPLDNKFTQAFKSIELKEKITSDDDRYSLVAILHRSDSNVFYFFNMSAADFIQNHEAKELISKFLSNIEITKL